MKVLISFSILFFRLFSILGQSNLNTGQIACFPINGNSNDYTGNGNHAGKYGALLVEDRFERPNSAYLFNGSSDYLEVNPNHLKIENFSVSIWAKPYSIPSGNRKQYLWSVGSSNGDQSIYISSEGIVVGGSISDSVSVFCQTSVTNILEWQHIVMIRESNNLLLYINGKSVCNKTNIGALPYYGTNFPRATFARRVAGKETYFEGILDDIHIYDRPLTPNEVKTLYEGEKQPEIKLEVDKISPCSGDIVNFEVKGASATANFLWKFNENNKETYTNKYELETLQQNTDYELNVSVEVVDDFSCFPQKPKKAISKIIVKACLELVNLKIPNIFTPNNDGFNDTWIIPNLDRIPEATISIYDRRGRKIYFSKGYEKPWDGKINGNVLPADSYNYSIGTNIKNKKAIQGSVTLFY